MIDAITNCCCGLSPEETLLQKTKAACISTDWDVPDNEELNLLVSIISGAYGGIDGALALNGILAGIQSGDKSKNIVFILKTLIVLDYIVQTRAFLSKIKQYYNGQLIYLETSQTQRIQPYKNLIAAYYLYVKQKAKYYELQEHSLTKRELRESYIKNANQLQILNEINNCFKIQNLILDVNKKFKNGDKSKLLIQFIYSLMLKTYLSCHSIVFIALKTFANRISTMSLYDLQYIKKFILFYNKQYTQNFNNFIETNQAIPLFKTISVGETLVRYPEMEKLIQSEINTIERDPGICPDPEPITSKETIEINTDQEIYPHLSDNHKEQPNQMSAQKRKQANPPQNINYTPFPKQSIL